MVTPLFSFFDNIEWKTEKLQTDIFISLIESMNQTSFEQVGMKIWFNLSSNYE